MSNQEKTPEGASPTVIHERCLCREMFDQVREAFGVSPKVHEHFTNSRIEFLKGIRAIIDGRIEHLSQAARRGTKIAVE
jgi:hypothetical protein